MKKFALLGLAAALLAGCAPTLAPHTPYLPMLRARGNTEVRVATGFGGSELQLGYQATSRLVLHTSLLDYRRLRTGRGFRSVDLGLGYYYLSPNGFWRLGMHGGLAYGSGTSGSASCFECVASNRYSSEYDLRYTYAYLQPTVLMLKDARQTWGFALRVGQTYYHRLSEVRTEGATGQSQFFAYAGHTSTFVQPMLQCIYQVRPWLGLSGRFGVQGCLGPRNVLNNMAPFVVQVGVHLLVGKWGQPRL